MKKLSKLQKGDKVAILSPSLAAPAVWPHVHELSLKRLRDVFGLEPVEYPTTRKLNASGEERSKDIIAAFEDPEIKAVISTLGGDDQVTYVKHLPSEPFQQNPKPFFGYSDNSHLCNFLFLNGIPSYYGGCLFVQFAMNSEMDKLTSDFISHALFDDGEFELPISNEFTEIGLNWDVPENLTKRRPYEVNSGWEWGGGVKGAEGLLWGGCIESVDEMLRHGVPIPSLKDFEEIILLLESSEEMPSADYVFRFMRALGERGILDRVRGVLVGRAKAGEFRYVTPLERRNEYRAEQQKSILRAMALYNPNIPIVQNLDFGHTDPQIPMPYGGRVRVDSKNKKIFASF